MAALSQSWRAVWRRPAFAATTILTLAAGIGVTAAAFAVLDAVVLKPLPYPSPDRLVSVMEASPSKRERISLIAPARLVDWNRLSRSFEVISGSYADNVTDTSGSAPERLAARRVMPRLFDVFGARPALGRTFAPNEEIDGGPSVVVISDGFWSRRFARSPSAIGARLTLGGIHYSVVGIMPPSFWQPGVDVWIPAQLSAWLLGQRDARFLGGIGRIRPGVTVEQARAELASVQRSLGATYPATDAGWTVEVTPLKEALVGKQRQPIGLVFGAVALLFVIALANTAGLMLVQLRRRSAELAVRVAIGASRRQVIGAVLREVALLAVIGAAAGLALAVVLVRLAVATLTTIPRITEAAIDARVAAFTALIAVAAVLAFGALPALFATRRGTALLGAPSRVAGGGHRLQGVLVASQVALGVLLAGGAGVLVRSYAALASADSGFVTSGVLTFHVAATWGDDRAQIGQLQERLLADLGNLPQVRSAGFTNFLPSTGATLRYQVTVEGLRGTDANGTMSIGERTVTSGYLPALGVPLHAGRWCESSQMGDNARHEVMVNRRFVDAYAGRTNLVGRHLKMVQGGGDTWTIVGIVGDAAEDTPGAPATPYVYMCMPYGSWPDPEYAVRTAGNPAAIASAVRDMVHRLDPSRPVFAVKTLDDVIASTMEQPRLNAAALSAFAGAALALVAIGLYALLMLTVTERRREFGVRIALGATSGMLMRTVFGDAARLVAAGMTAGIVLLLLAGRFLQSLVFGVTPHDPVAVAAGLAALAVVALAAAVLPLRRAAAVDPIDALREI
jgi:predicted permease